MLFGITGGIGSGKSYVCRRIASMGFPVYDCDTQARRLMTDDTRLVEAVKRLVGEDAYVEGQLNKPVVARYLFGDADHAARLNALVHPAVRRDFVRWAQAQHADHAFVESAILFEAEFDKLLDRVVCVTAPLAVRIERVMERDHCDEAAVHQRMERQMDDFELCRRADYILLNDGQHDIDLQLRNILSDNTTSPIPSNNLKTHKLKNS